MPIATNLIYTSMNNGKKISKNISFCNPEATDEKLAEFMGAVSSLSQNTFVSLERVEKHEISVPNANPTTPALKDPQLSVNPTSISIDDMAKSNPTISVSRLGNGTITATHNSSIIERLSVNGTTVTVHCTDSSVPEPGTATITISVAATDEYKAASVEVPYEVTEIGTDAPVDPEEPVVD